MLAAGSADGRPRVRAQGERLPFADESFDHVTFTYLLRYVDDPAATIRELTRVLRPSGRLATLEFGVPANSVWRFLWRLYTRIVLPLAGRLLSSSWGTVGDFLGPSIEGFYAAHPQTEVECYWRAAGLEALGVKRLSFGGGIVMSATKTLRTERRTPPSTTEPVAAPTRTPSAFYALSPGGWRDYWTLLHPPYTAWHLSYVLLGAALAPTRHTHPCASAGDTRSHGPRAGGGPRDRGLDHRRDGCVGSCGHRGPTRGGLRFGDRTVPFGPRLRPGLSIPRRRNCI